MGDLKRLKPLLEKLQWGQGQVQCLHQAEKWEGSLNIGEEHVKVREICRVQWVHPENKPSGSWAGWTQ